MCDSVEIIKGFVRNKWVGLWFSLMIPNSRATAYDGKAINPFSSHFNASFFYAIRDSIEFPPLKRTFFLLTLLEVSAPSPA